MNVRKQVMKTSVALASRLAPGPTGRLAFRVFCTPPRSQTPTPGEMKIAARMAPLIGGAKSFDIPTRNGSVRAYVWSAKPSVAHRGRVLLVHGWTGRALVMGAFVTPLLEAGIDVVALDLPAHGDSEGRILNLALGAMAVQAVADVLGPFDGAVTHSFGGPVTLLAAEGGLPLGQPMPVARLVLISAPNSLGDITRMFGREAGLSGRAQVAMEGEVMRIAGRPIETFRCDTFLADIGVPALIVHDADDAELPFANAEAIVAAAPAATLLRTTKLGHRRIIFSPTVVRAAVEFLVGPSPERL
jgi:pimeloyl-ACP methyl ester carboxylesterase